MRGFWILQIGNLGFSLKGFLRGFARIFSSLFFLLFDLALI